MKKKKIKKRIKGEKNESESEIENANIILQRSQSSVSIKKDAKGNTLFELKVYADDVEEARKLAVENFEVLAGELGLVEE